MIFTPTFAGLSRNFLVSMKRKKPGFQRRNPGFWDVTGPYRMSVWWSWGDLNPRPQAILAQIYMFSGLI